MKYLFLTTAVAPFLLMSPAVAYAGSTAETKTDEVIVTAPLQAASVQVAPPVASDTVTTGVAKGRDRLDSATSTSSLREAEIGRLAPRSIGDLMRAIPGVRSEASTGEGNANISIRGLPLASSGAKFVQLQEDGLPVLEFGDMSFLSSDIYLRADLNLQQVDSIRGGSASTFASNSPGGIINFISKTGETEGGAVALSGGLDYSQYRADFDYGMHLSDSLRMHVGGFYRQGEGPREAGYDAQRGGQIKANVTKTFDGGYIRFYGKYLDDRSPYYDYVPLNVTGTNADPEYSAVAGIDPTSGSMLSRYNRSVVMLDPDNNVATFDVREGQHAIVRSVGAEAQVELGGWTITEKFRYSDIGGQFISMINTGYGRAGTVLANYGGPNGVLSYANGPQTGMTITDLTGLNGNGLIATKTIEAIPVNLDNVTNDVRASRTWPVGGGDLTTTAGFYASRQTIDKDQLWTTLLSEVRGDGNAALLNVTNGAGQAVTQTGVLSYNLIAFPGRFRRRTRVDYAVNAPFASANYQIGKVALGASIRYDFGTVDGELFGSDLGGGRVGAATRDINGDGVISLPETRVTVTPLGSPAPVNYDYGFFSYSASANYRMAENYSVFGRYSQGGRANADRLLFTGIVSTTTGDLTSPDAAYDPAKQAEIGAKYRTSDLTLNLTGFWAEVQDTNWDTVTATPIAREYSAFGAEFEGGIRRGIFGLTASATITKAEIVADAINAAVVGNTPRHQADVIFQVTPQITTDRFNFGAVVIGTTGSFAQDTNLLEIPGYVTTNAFVQYRPVDRLLLSLNANNLFDVLAITDIGTGTIPATGIVTARPLNGRTISLTARMDF